MDIKPIETLYNGYRFRSRLEARWAVFFDTLNVEYTYEPEGIVLQNGEYYLPDFYLPKLETFVEIKPSNAFKIKLNDDGAEFPKEANKYAFATDAIVNGGKMFLIAFGDPYEAFPRLDNGKTDCKSHLFYYGECGIYYIFKEANKNGRNFTCEDEDGNKKDCSECDHHKQISMHSFPVFIINDEFVVADRECIFNEHIIPFPFILENDGKSIRSKESSAWKKFHDAGSKARQARFEHGEIPIFNTKGE